MAFKFLKKGKAALAAYDAEEAAAEARKAQSDAPRRYWMPEGKETQITFLDGDLDDDGLLNVVSYWEHNLKINGNWRNWFPCTQLEEPCPICEGGDDAKLVSAFTVLDHSEWKDGKGNVHRDEKRLFVCKRETFRRLQKIASKRGGLAGITFDVSRTGDKSAGVGDTFDFVEKRTLKAIAKAYDLEMDEVQPFDYEEVISYRPAKELRKLGFGAGGKGAPGSADVDDEDDPKPKSMAKKAVKKTGKSAAVGDADDPDSEGYAEQV